MSKKNRQSWITQARRLAWITLGYNILEAAACAWFGIQDQSLALMGFGGDSLIEASAGAVILWRFKASLSVHGSASRAELEAQKLISVLLVALALFLAMSAVFEWREGKGPRTGAPGMMISGLSLALMGWLYRRKMACAAALDSAALRADAFCTLSCMWLSGLLFAGSLLFAGTKLAWFDAATTLGMAALIAKEGVEEYDESSEELEELD